MFLRILFLQFLIFLLTSCAKPYLLPTGRAPLSPAYTENIDYMRSNYFPANIDTPLSVVNTVSINGTTTGTLCLVNAQLFFSTQNGRIYSMSADDISDYAKKKAAAAITAAPTFLRDKLFLSVIRGKHGLLSYDLTRRKLSAAAKQDFSTASPVVFRDKIIHAAVSGSIYAFDSETGQLSWKADLGDQIIRSLSFDGRHLFALSQSGILRCFNADKGSVIWSQRFDDHFYVAPLLNKTSVFLAGYKGQLLRIDKKSGELQKRIELNRPVLRSLSATDNELVVSATDGLLRVYDAQLEHIKWQITLDAPAAIPALITDNAVISGTAQKSLYILDKKKGRILQKIKLEGRPASLPVIYKGKLIMGLEYEKIVELRVKK